MTAIGELIHAALGTSTLIDGFTCIPTVPASLAVQVTPGSICLLDVVDSSSYGSLTADSMPLMKMGYSRTTSSITITPPSTSGYAQNYLIEVAFSETSDTPVLLPYYNPDDPAAPLQGTGNSGVEQDTRRSQLAILNLKSGTAAPAGTQVTPTVDAGYVPMFVVTVAQGQTTITSTDITVHPTAPFIAPKLPDVPAAIQAQAGNYAVDAGTANAVSVTLPLYTSVHAGMPLRIKKGVTANTTSVTLAVNGVSPVSVVWADGTALAGGDWPANAIGEVVYTGTVWQLIGVAGPTIFSRVPPEAGPVVTDAALVHYGVDTGTANAITASSVSPTVVGTVTTGMQFEIAKGATANTGGVTASISGQAGAVVWADGSALVAGDWPASTPALLMFDGTDFKVLSMMGPSVFARGASFQPTATLNFYVRPDGNDANDGLSNSSGHAFLTIQGAVDAITYRYISLKQANINIANGTYAGAYFIESSIATWNLVGNVSTPASVAITAASPSVSGGRGFVAFSGATVVCGGFAFTTYYESVAATGGGVLTLHDCNFTPPTSADPIVCSQGSSLFIYGTVRYTGAFGSLIAGSDCSYVNIGNASVSFIASGTTSFTTGFVNCSACSSARIVPTNTSFSGTVTGPRYSVTLNGVLITGGSGATYLPGNASGASSTGGQYT